MKKLGAALLVAAALLWPSPASASPVDIEVIPEVLTPGDGEFGYGNYAIEYRTTLHGGELVQEWFCPGQTPAEYAVIVERCRLVAEFRTAPEGFGYPGPFTNLPPAPTGAYGFAG